METKVLNPSRYNRLIIVLSVIIPLLVVLLFNVKIKGIDLSFLPPVYASINAVTALLLIISVRAIKQGQRALHQKLMKTCIALSATFLLLYVAYHITSENTTYEGTGILRYFYYVLLFSHILLSVAVVPLVLFSFARALNQNFERHRKLARITYPIWLYVAVSGVLVYIMISPYYQ